MKNIKIKSMILIDRILLKLMIFSLWLKCNKARALSWKMGFYNGIYHKNKKQLEIRARCLIKLDKIQARLDKLVLQSAKIMKLKNKLMEKYKLYP
jgi:hypothetical protein